MNQPFTPEARERMKRAGIDPDEWLKKMRERIPLEQENIKSILRQKQKNKVEKNRG